MKAIVLVTLLGLLHSALTVKEYPVPDYLVGGTPWPMPSEYIPLNGNFSIVPQNFKFVVTGKTNDILQSAFARYMNLTFPYTVNDTNINNTLKELQVNVAAASPNDQIQLETDESYYITIEASGAYLYSSTVFGAIRGLETFSQLVLRIPDGYMIKFVVISDKPRYPWRGLLIDTARHYLSVETIKRTIRAMSYNKLNVLHWHIVDGQSFPYVSKVYPYLSARGAYHPEEIYTQEQIADIITFANYHAVRIVPEFDMPGHATSWGFGYPFLIMNCTTQDNVYDFDDGWGDQPMDPTNPAVYQFVDNLLKELTNLFVDDYLHLGGDEVAYECWNTTKVNNYMKANNISSYAKLESSFIHQIFPLARKYGVKVLYWEEVFENTSPSRDNVIIDVWKSFQELGKVVSANFNGILSAGWYLDSLYSTWYDFYNVDPDAGNLPPNQANLILGGEVSSWGESVDDSNSDTRIWPRGCSVAEKLWSPREKTSNATLALPRLLTQRCVLVKRGIGATPIQPGPSCY